MSASAQTSLACPACGAATVAGDHFCEACGADLPGAPPPLPASGSCPSCGADSGAAQDGYCPGGRVHPRNEDAYALHVDDEVATVVCDGVSTTVNPDEASQAAATAALEVLIADPSDPPLRLLAAYDAARAAVQAVDGQPEPPDLGWPSCTFLACLVVGKVVDLASLGDCRTYWLPVEGEPQLLTEDDSWAAEQIAAGTLTPAEAYADPMAHTITRWIGRDADPSWRPRLLQFAAPAEGRLVLCSDGLWNYALGPSDVATAAGSGDPITGARRLTAFANDQGGHDNITVVVVDVPRTNVEKGQTP